MTSTLPITAIIATKNEEANIHRCLSSLTYASKVLIIDSGSTDRTLEIASTFNASVVQFRYAGGYPKKRQWALDNLTITTEWILLIDADEAIPEELWNEIRTAINSNQPQAAYLITKGFHFLGKKFRFGGFSHAAILLFKRNTARFEQLIDVPGDKLDMEVHERVIVSGPIGKLRTPLIHEDFKGLASYIDKHNKYSTWEAHLRYSFLTSGTYGQDSVKPRLLGNSQEKRRWLKHIAIRIPFESWLWFLYHFIFKLGFMEGRAGRIACDIRRQYISNVRAKIFELEYTKRRDRIRSNMN